MEVHKASEALTGHGEVAATHGEVAATDSRSLFPMKCLLPLLWLMQMWELQRGSPVLEMLQLLAQERCMKKWT